MSQAIKYRAARLGVLLASVSATPVFAQTAGKRTGEQIRASFEAHRNEFDYLLGDWEFTAESREYGKFRGYCRPVDRRWRDLGKGLSADRGAPHRPAAFHGSARSGQETRRRRALSSS
jgi:hypothetical protein